MNITINDLLIAGKYENVKNSVKEMISKVIQKRPNCQQILNNKKLWYFNIEILKNDSIYKDIIKSKNAQSITVCFHKYFIYKKILLPSFVKVLP